MENTFDSKFLEIVLLRFIQVDYSIKWDNFIIIYYQVIYTFKVGESYKKYFITSMKIQINSKLIWQKK